MKKLNKVFLIPLVLLALTTGSTVFAVSPSTINLGAADGFAVIAGSTITNTGSSVVTGDLGLNPGSSISGFPPGTLNGNRHVADALAIQAQTDLTNAYNDASSRSNSSTIGTELGGTTKTAGVYDAGTFGVSGTLTLDAQGDPNAVFIFRSASTLVTAGSSNIVLTGSAQACKVFWQVGSSATLGTNSTFKGNILALTAATLTTGANVEGRVLARNAAVTLDSSTVTKPNCVTTAVAVTPAPTPVVTPTPVAQPTPVVVAPVTAPIAVVAPVQAVIPKLPNTGIGPDSE
jgi:hypothetical protein